VSTVNSLWTCSSQVLASNYSCFLLTIGYLSLYHLPTYDASTSSTFTGNNSIYRYFWIHFARLKKHFYWLAVTNDTFSFLGKLSTYSSQRVTQFTTELRQIVARRTSDIILAKVRTKTNHDACMQPTLSSPRRPPSKSASVKDSGESPRQKVFKKKSFCFSTRPELETVRPSEGVICQTSWRALLAPLLLINLTSPTRKLLHVILSSSLSTGLKYLPHCRRLQI
jgi:hypothetical protein